jgi:DNA-binding XRE family transcriptional regulator
MKHFSMNSLLFSEKIGIQKTTLEYILNGRNSPSLLVIQKICQAYPEINPGWLILGRGDLFGESNSSKIIEEIFSKECNVFKIKEMLKYIYEHSEN